MLSVIRRQQIRTSSTFDMNCTWQLYESKSQTLSIIGHRPILKEKKCKYSYSWKANIFVCQEKRK